MIPVSSMTILHQRAHPRRLSQALCQPHLCLYLQHRHHTVGADEAVVKVEGAAHLMDDQAVEDIISFGNKAVPTTWMISGGKLLSMEFAVVPAGYVVFLQHFLVASSRLTTLDSRQDCHTTPTPTFI
jgi:hypothetical protein